MLTYRCATFIFFLYIVSASWANAACSFNTPVFEGTLSVQKTDEYGFVTVLATPESALSAIFLNCSEGIVATLRVLPPERADDHVPILASKPRSFFIYQGKHYGTDEKLKSALITDGLEDELVQVGIVVGNGEDVLLASDNYQYLVRLQLTIEEDANEAEGDVIFGEETLRTIEFVMGNDD